MASILKLSILFLSILHLSGHAANQITCSEEVEDDLHENVCLLQTAPSRIVHRKLAPSEYLQKSGPTSQDDTYELSDGVQMPVIGLGCYRLQPGNETYSSVLAALQLGYRMIDTAALYRNEEDVGQAVRDSGIPRSEIFVTTKIWEDDHGFDAAIAAGLKSNVKLDLGYIDLLLMHSPKAGKIVETWDAMKHLQDIGVAKSIGVSNFGVPHLKAFKTYCRPTPTVNQFELHPLNAASQQPLVDYCKQANILVQSYGSVLSGHTDLLDQATSIASSYNKTSSQVLLRWALDKGYQVIPKSSHVNYLAENLDVFDFTLSDSDSQALERMKPEESTKADGGLVDYWVPELSPVDIGDTSHSTGCS